MIRLPGAVCLAFHMAVILPASTQDNFSILHKNGDILRPRQQDTCPAMSMNRISQCSTKKTVVKLVPGKSVVFQSPNYDSPTSSSTCKWFFKSKQDIVITCEDFLLANRSKNGQCKEDKMKIHKTEYCGTEPIDEDPERKNLKVIFKSNGKSNTTRFSCRATAKLKPPPNISDDCACGEANVTRYVGNKTEVIEYPWMAAILPNDYMDRPNIDGRPFVLCAGTVIASNLILTACMCTQWLKNYKIPFKIRVGANDLTEEDPESTYEAAYFNEHPYFKSAQNVDKRLLNLISKYNTDFVPKRRDDYTECDISVIVLERHINFTESGVRPICLPPDGRDLYDNVTATVAGWESVFGKEFANGVKTEDLPTMTNSYCHRFYGASKCITDNFMCVSGENSNCMRNYGSPLFYKPPGNGFTQIGIFSEEHDDTCDNYSPAMYSRITKFLDRIPPNEERKDSQFCSRAAAPAPNPDYTTTA